MDSELRKKRSEKVLSENGVTINPHLPLIESESEANIRAPKDVARRVIILCCIAAVADGVEKEKIYNFLDREKLWGYASSNEIQFLKNENPTKKELIHATWRSEAVWILLWAMGHVESLGLPIEQCSVKDIVDIVPSPKESTKQFIAEANLRSVKEILDASDLMYRTHWATRERGLNDDTECADLDDDIVMERHYAINWLTCYNDADWDDITTDT